MMDSAPVRAWISTDANGRSLLRLSRPKETCGVWYSDDMALFVQYSPVQPGDCREYALVPADQYRQPSAELSPVAKLIAEMAHSAGIALAQLGSPHTAETLAQLAARQVKAAITAAREIESEAK